MTGKPHVGQGQGESATSPRRLQAIEKGMMALELRKGGASYTEIAHGLGYANKSGAYKAVMKAIRRALKGIAEPVVELELMRLDAILSKLWLRMMDGDLGAVDRILRVMERRSALLGLDKPKKIAPTDPSGDNAYAGLSENEIRERILAIVARDSAETGGHDGGDGDGPKIGGDAGGLPGEIP